MIVRGYEGLRRSLRLYLPLQETTLFLADTPTGPGNRLSEPLFQPEPEVVVPFLSFTGGMLGGIYRIHDSLELRRCPAGFYGIFWGIASLTALVLAPETSPEADTHHP